jgi:hypothetical protein
VGNDIVGPEDGRDNGEEEETDGGRMWAGKGDDRTEWDGGARETARGI